MKNIPISKSMCAECKDLPEGKVVGGHDHSMAPTVEKMLSGLDFVQWDRFTYDGIQYNFYGWINRTKDAYKDFLILQYWPQQEYWYWVSSSVEYDLMISKIVDGPHADTEPCQRIEEYVDIKNAIHLK